MQATFKQSAAQDQWLLWAIVCSVLLHLAVVLIVPNFNLEAPQEIIHELKIELMQPKQAQAEPEIAQESPAAAEPAPLKPEPIKKPKPEPLKKQAEPVKELTPVEISQEIAAPSPPPEVMQVAPSADVKPTVTAPISPPPQPIEASRPTGPSDGDIEAARNAYRNNVSRELRRNQRYPKIAETRGIEGDVKLEISINNEGNVIDVQIAESSGNDSLDRAALDAVRRSNLRQYMQEILRGRIDKITVTVGFKLTQT